MQKLNLSALLIALPCALTFAAGLPIDNTATNVSRSATAPRIRFATNIYDFGTIKQGESVTYTFTFTNTGNATLEILDVKAGCGCTTAGAWDKKVEPGGVGHVPLRFDSSAFGGPVSKTATVTCNDPAQPATVLAINGTVWKAFNVEPQHVVFSIYTEAQTNQVKRVKITSNLEEPVRMYQVTSPFPQLKGEIHEIKSGKEFELLVSAVPPFTNGNFSAALTVRTSSSQASNVVLNAFVAVQEPVSVSPQLIMIPPGPTSNVHTSVVTITYHGTNALKVTEPQITLSGASVTVHEVNPGRVFKLQAVVPAGTRALNNPQLSFRTDHPRFPEVKLAIYEAQAGTVIPNPAPITSPAQVVIGAPRPVPTRAAATGTR